MRRGGWLCVFWGGTKLLSLGSSRIKVVLMFVCLFVCCIRVVLMDLSWYGVIFTPEGGVTLEGGSEREERER